ncbi:MAG: HAMP domain-containing protein [Chloroflexi bacterium]|nr:HAMP domain-containing protein [Chloroflexota bacterium]
MEPDLMKTSEVRYNHPLARSAAAFLSLPLRFKITIPYLVVAILLAGLATWVITQSFVTRLQERFNIQLVDGFETASTEVFQAESKALITERAIARTAGVAEAALAREPDNLNTLTRPLVVNAHVPLVHVLDNSGTLIYGLRLTPEGSVRDEAADFAAWMPVRRVLADERDDLGDKFSGVMTGPGGPALYVAGPLLLNNQRVGVVLAGFPLSTLLPKMIADSATQVTLYQPDGQAAFSTFPKEVHLPALTSEVLVALNVAGSRALQNRLWILNANEYNDAIGPLLVRGQPSGWAVAVTLPRALITSSARMSPTQLAMAFTLAVVAVIALGVVIARIIAIPVFELVTASSQVAKGDLKAEVPEQSQDELGMLSRQFNQMVSQLRQRELMRDLFGRMVSEEVREAVLQGDQLQLSGELKVVSVLFTDIREFTNFSERHSPQEVVGMLNTYFSIVNGAVRDAGGMINKFGGDSTMAIFGAPVKLEPSETARRALRAALSIRIRITEFNARRLQEGLKPINIGIGINTGEVITGNVGAEERFEYTVIGDTVNVAARIQGLSSQFTDSNILISEEVYKTYGERDELLVVDQGAVALKGRTESVRVYNLIGMRLMKTSTNIAAEDQTQSDEVPHRNVLETVYLYCRGFDPTTIAATKNLPLESVQLWIKDAASRFEQSKQELNLEFKLTDIELQRLYDANHNSAAVAQL